MTVDELKKEIKYIEQQKAAGKVGTPNVYVRLTALQDELATREEECEIEVSEETNQKLEDLLKELQEKGENVNMINDVVTYLLNHQKK
jgi:molybdopterin converting factor small subunit